MAGVDPGGPGLETQAARGKELVFMLLTNRGDILPSLLLAVTTPSAVTGGARSWASKRLLLRYDGLDVRMGRDIDSKHGGVGLGMGRRGVQLQLLCPKHLRHVRVIPL